MYNSIAFKDAQIKAPETSGSRKIAILGSFPPLRAISSYCLALATALAQTGPVVFHSFKSLYPAFLYPTGRMQEDQTLPGDVPPTLTVFRSLTWYNPLSWIRAALSGDADLLHAQWWSMPLAPVYLTICAGFKLRRKPVVFTVHNVLPHEPSAAYVQVSRLLFRLGDHFIVHTAVGKRQLETFFGVPTARISVIPHGALGFQVREGVDRNAVRQQFGIGPDQRVILLFGTIRPYKGVDTAIAAMTRIAEKAPGARLLIAGNPWQPWEPYARQIAQSGLGSRVITALGYIPSDELYRYFEAADLVLLPYHHFDSQSGVGATAAAFGKPMIVSDVGGLPDLVASSRWVVPPADPAALADAVVDALQTPGALAQMAADSASVRRRLSWEGIAKSTRAVYGSVYPLARWPVGRLAR